MSTAPHPSVASGAPIVADAPGRLAGARVVPALRYALEDGFGLRSMRTRAADAGGRLEITSEPGRGTVVRAEVPAEQT